MPGCCAASLDCLLAVMLVNNTLESISSNPEPRLGDRLPGFARRNVQAALRITVY